VRTLIVGGDLEGRTGAGGGLLEDQGDLLAGELFDLGTGVLGQLERLASLSRKRSSAGLKSISLRKLRFFRL